MLEQQCLSHRRRRARPGESSGRRRILALWLTLTGLPEESSYHGSERLYTNQDRPRFGFRLLRNESTGAKIVSERVKYVYRDEGRRNVNAEALEQIETKIAFLEYANAELSDTLSRQQRDIEALRSQIAALTARIQELRDPDITLSTAEGERPPHY